MASRANFIIQIPTTQAMQEHIFVQDTIHLLNCAMSVVPNHVAATTTANPDVPPTPVLPTPHAFSHIGVKMKFTPECANVF